MVKKTMVLISGKAQHGKDTFADGLAKFVSRMRCGKSTFVKMSFAAGIKDLAYSLGWNGEKDEKGRALLQTIGNGARQYDENIWVKNLIAKLDVLDDNLRPPFVAVSDCRHENEITYVKDWGEKNGYAVYTVRITRPDFDNGLTEAAKAHVSEVALDAHDFDLFLRNDAPTAEEFQRDAFLKFASAFPEFIRSVHHSWEQEAGKAIPFIHGTDLDLIRAFRNKTRGDLVTIDFDDTLLEKTGSVDRLPFFRVLAKAGITGVILTARSSRVEEIEAFLGQNGLSAAAVIYDAGEKGDVLDILRPLCHFDDDPKVAEDAFRTKIPVFTMGEFYSPDYRRLWVDFANESGEGEFYLKHNPGRMSIEEVAESRMMV